MTPIETSLELKALQTNITNLADRREFHETFFLFRYYSVTLGGYRIKKPTSIKPGEYHHGIPAGEGYHTETSFSPEQAQYVSRTLGYLYALLSGKPFNGPQATPLSQKIQNRYIPGDSFTSAIAYGFQDTLSEFGERYPTLTPVLQAIYGTGGSRVTFSAIGHSERFVSNAIDGKLTHENKKEFGNISRDRFIRRNITENNDGENGYDFEERCSGISIALGIIEQAKNAALAIAPSLNGKTPRGEYIHTPSDVYISQMQNLVKGMYDMQVKRHIRSKPTS